MSLGKFGASIVPLYGIVATFRRLLSLRGVNPSRSPINSQYCSDQPDHLHVETLPATSLIWLGPPKVVDPPVLPLLRLQSGGYR
ncbi:MAG: hypothetical protein MJA27_13845 [Pseudanabaenales cyanobacterium]|nr:hypothetical protein [Pseudanabaenales cyanobacterium]